MFIREVTEMSLKILLFYPMLKLCPAEAIFILLQRSSLPVCSTTDSVIIFSFFLLVIQRSTISQSRISNRITEIQTSGRLFTERGSRVMKQKTYQWADDVYNKIPLPNVKCHSSRELK